jgi:Taurine catabolism dioxygenase TauD, TfdA family
MIAAPHSGGMTVQDRRAMNYIDRDNPVFSERIQSPAAWTGSEIGGKAGVSHRLTVAQIETLWDLVERTRHRALTDATRADFADPLIDRLMHDVRHELIHGKGIVLLSGLDIGGRSIEDFGRLYWGLGTYVGTAAVNNRGERLCRVQYETDDRVAGVGYLRNIELLAHTDYHEVLGLAAYQRAETGGETGLVSSLAIHNVCLQERPAYLKALYEGYFHVAPGSDQVLPQKAPLFSNVGGTISFSTHFRQYHEAAARLGQQLPSELMAALDFVQEVASRPELRVTFTLEPGEILFWHNFTLLHSRTAFTNSEDRKRLLLRLWLNVPNGRAMHSTFNERTRGLDRMNEEAATRKSPA